MRAAVVGEAMLCLVAVATFTLGGVACTETGRELQQQASIRPPDLSLNLDSLIVPDGPPPLVDAAPPPDVAPADHDRERDDGGPCRQEGESCGDDGPGCCDGLGCSYTVHSPTGTCRKQQPPCPCPMAGQPGGTECCMGTRGSGQDWACCAADEVCKRTPAGLPICEPAPPPPPPPPPCGPHEHACGSPASWCCGTDYSCGAAAGECTSPCANGGSPCGAPDEQGDYDCCPQGHECRYNSATASFECIDGKPPEGQTCPEGHYFCTTDTCCPNASSCVAANPPQCCADGTYYHAPSNSCLPVQVNVCDAQTGAYCDPGFSCCGGVCCPNTITRCDTEQSPPACVPLIIVLL